MFLNNEDLIYSNKIIKIKKKPEDRIIVITSKYIYNLKGKKYRRNMNICVKKHFNPKLIFNVN